MGSGFALNQKTTGRGINVARTEKKKLFMCLENHIVAKKAKGNKDGDICRGQVTGRSMEITW